MLPGERAADAAADFLDRRAQHRPRHTAVVERHRAGLRAAGARAAAPSPCRWGRARTGSTRRSTRRRRCRWRRRHCRRRRRSPPPPGEGEVGESDSLLQATAVLARMTRIATRIGSVERIVGGTASLMPTAGTGLAQCFGPARDRHYNALSLLTMSILASRPWTRHYAPETAPDLPPPAFSTVAALVRHSARKFRDNRAFSLLLPNGTAGHLTFAEVDVLSDALAVYLREVAGLAAGDRIAVQMPNCLAYPIVTFARAQGVAGDGEHQPALHGAGDGAPVRRQRRGRAGDHRSVRRPGRPGLAAARSIRTVIVVTIADLLPWLKRMVVRAVQKYVKKQVPPIDFAHVTFEDALAARPGARRFRRRSRWCMSRRADARSRRRAAVHRRHHRRQQGRGAHRTATCWPTSPSASRCGSPACSRAARRW